MSYVSFALRNQLIGALQDIEGHTERIFLALAESLPALVREMRRSFEQSEDAICSMGHHEAGCTDQLMISSLVEQASKEMRSGAERFREISEHDGELFAQVQSGISQLEEISHSIPRITVDSEDMELVSLNAMTVALKAGNAGRAFSFITEELQRLAARTIDLSQSIAAQGHELIESFRHLETLLTEAREFQHRLIDSFESRIFSSFHEVQTAVEATVEGLRALRGESEQLRAPVNGMMEAIQLQDLIRQSIDHIIVALEKIRPEEEVETEDKLLDELAFTRQIPALASTLIEHVAEQIDESIGTFVRLTEEAEQKRAQLEENQQRFTRGQLSEAVGIEEQSLDILFEKASAVLQELIADLDRNMRNKETLVERSSSITRNVESLEEQFHRFNTLVTRFHSIDIASRIEVAKQEVLRSMGSTAEQMTALTRQIESDVDQSLRSTRDFIKSVSVVIVGHRNHVEEEHEFVERFSSKMRSRYQALSESREAVAQNVAEFSLFTDGFHDVFEQSKENGHRLSSLSADIRNLKADLQKMEEEIETRYNEVLSRRGLASWAIENDRLREIIERFTIFSDKQRVGQLSGVDIGESVQAGEVTLF